MILCYAARQVKPLKAFINKDKCHEEKLSRKIRFKHFALKCTNCTSGSEVEKIEPKCKKEESEAYPSEINIKYM